MVNSKLYTGLEQYVDLSEFDKLHYKICRGFSKARNLATVGNLEVNMENILTNESYVHLCQTYKSYKSFPLDSELKQSSQDLDENELAVFLKFSLGGYDLYQTYFIEALRDYFPETHNWILDLKNRGIFSSISESYFLTLDAGGIPVEHYHPDNGSASEFLHIRPANMIRPFYVRDSKTLEKVYVDSRVAWWDDRMIHGGDAMLFPTYTLRIDGVFTDEFRQKVMHG